MKRFQDGIDMPYKDARVPVKFIALYEHLRKFPQRFFDERFDFIEVFFLIFFRNLDVAVTCFRIAGFDAQCQKLVRAGSKFQWFQDVPFELIHFENQVVGRGDDDTCVRVDFLDDIRSVCDGRSRISVFFLYDELRFLEVGERVQHQFPVMLVGSDENILRRKYLLVSFVSLLQERLPSSKEVEELFG